MKVSKDIERLRQLDYVEVLLKGREKEVSLTELGKMIVSYQKGEI